MDFERTIGRLSGSAALSHLCHRRVMSLKLTGWARCPTVAGSLAAARWSPRRGSRRGSEGTTPCGVVACEGIRRGWTTSARCIPATATEVESDEGMEEAQCTPKHHRRGG